MAKIKKLETLIKALETVSEEELVASVANENIQELSNKEMLAVMAFNELKKALDTKDVELLLDCNFAKSKNHNRTQKEIEKGIEDEWLVDYYRLVSKASGQSMIQFYAASDLRRGTLHYRLATSCSKLVREQFEAMEDELHFTVKRTKEGAPRWSERKNIPYDEVVDIVKSVCAVLSSSAELQEKKKEEKKATKKDSAEEEAA